MFSGHTKQEEPEDRANNFRVARDAFKIELVPTVLLVIPQQLALRDFRY